MEKKDILENIIFDLFGRCEYDEYTCLDEIVKNSIGYIRFIVEIENKFDIEFEDEMLNISYFKNISQLLRYLQNES